MIRCILPQRFDPLVNFSNEIGFSLYGQSMTTFSNDCCSFNILVSAPFLCKYKSLNSCWSALTKSASDKELSKDRMSST